MLLYLIGIGLLLLSTVGNSLLAVYPQTLFNVNISAAVLGMALGSLGTMLIRYERKRRKKLKRKRRYRYYKPHYYHHR